MSFTYKSAPPLFNITNNLTCYSLGSIPLLSNISIRSIFSFSTAMISPDLTTDKSFNTLHHRICSFSWIHIMMTTKYWIWKRGTTICYSEPHFYNKGESLRFWSEAPWKISLSYEVSEVFIRPSDNQKFGKKSLPETSWNILFQTSWNAIYKNWRLRQKGIPRCLKQDVLSCLALGEICFELPFKIDESSL